MRRDEKDEEALIGCKLNRRTFHVEGQHEQCAIVSMQAWKEATVDWMIENERKEVQDEASEIMLHPAQGMPCPAE